MSKKLNFDFKKINSLALAQSEAVVSNYAPNGKLEGREWVAVNPSRSDNKARSFSVNVDTGLWADFATNDKGGDLVGYVAYCLRISQGDAYKMLTHFLGVSDEEISNPTKLNPIQPAPEVKPKEPNDFIAIFPPPPEAAKTCLLNHPQLNKPVMHWDYLSSSGDLLQRVCRYERINSAGEKEKDYRACIYGNGLIKKGVNAGSWRLGWHWKQLKENVPLYGLDRLAKLPQSVPIIMAEGEKSADACYKLFPNYPSMCWCAGSKNIKKADFSPLAGREVWLWPDNDEAGQQTIEILGKALGVVGVSAFRVFDLSAFSQYSPAPNGELLQVASDWPPKSDAHDALVMGWTAQHLAELEKRGALLLPVEGDTKEPMQLVAHVEEKPASEAARGENIEPENNAPFGFKVDDVGTHWYDSKAEKYRRICARLDVVALCRDVGDAGINWGVFVRFKNLDQCEKSINFPRELFGTDGGAEIIKRLLNMGLDFDGHREAKRKVVEYLQACKPKDRIGLVPRTGWYKNAFVLPNRTIGISKEPLLFHTEGASLCKLSERGTLKDWQENVARFCVGNTRACFAVSAAFSAPLVRLLSVEIVGLNFWGGSGIVKSTLLKMACSVYGDPESYKQSWKATSNGLEILAAHHSDMLLALDEIGEFADDKKIGETIYMLGNGKGKTRANDRGGARSDASEWKFSYISNGELTLDQYMTNAGQVKKAGQEQRFLEVFGTPHTSPLDIEKMGIYEELHGYENGALLSKFIDLESSKSCGTPFIKFIEKLTEELNGEKSKDFISGMRAKVKKLSEKLANGKAGQTGRAADKFALVAWAGELAADWGITSWPLGQATLAATACYKSWLAARGGDGNFEEKQMLDHIRHTISIYGESRFKRWDEPQLAANSNDLVIDTHVPITAECWGLRRENIDKNVLDGDTSDVDFYVYKESFKKDLCKGFDADRMARLLRDTGALILTDSEKRANRLYTRPRLPRMGKSKRDVYRIRNSLLFGGVDDEESELQNAA